jgi:hypothetical protein
MRDASAAALHDSQLQLSACLSDLKEWDVTDFSETVLKQLAVANP